MIDLKEEIKKMIEDRSQAYERAIDDARIACNNYNMACTKILELIKKMEEKQDD